MRLSRRAVLRAATAAAFAAGPLSGRRAAFGDTPRSGMPLDGIVRDITVEGDRSRRFTLLVPTHLGTNERVPLLILLHGLGETIDERMGAFAWIERYGLGTAYDRLRRAPIARTTTRADWTDARVSALNAQLAVRPFRGLVIACPYMPDLPIGAPGVLDGFARWLTDVVAPRARAESNGLTLDGPENTMLGGCSLGGHFSLELFIRRPESFSCWGGVQTAIREGAAPMFADRVAAALARVGPRAIHVQTSEGDPFRAANEALSEALTKRGVTNEFLRLPGPHDQAWLRESGTLEMLLWHDELPRNDPRIPRDDL